MPGEAWVRKRNWKTARVFTRAAHDRVDDPDAWFDRTTVGPYECLFRDLSPRSKRDEHMRSERTSCADVASMKGSRSMSDQKPLRRPRRFSAVELAKCGVELLSEDHVWLRCKPCQQTWSPNLRSGGRLPGRWWQCPNACNADAAR